MKFTEEIIATGQKLYVYGNAQLKGNLSSSHVENIMIARKKRGFFYISPKSEIDVLKSFGRNVMLQIYLGAIISTVCLSIFIAQLGG